MATITPSALISEIRGRVGSEIFSKNLYGAYVKTSYAPTDPNTTLQQNARTRFNNALAAWNALTRPQQLAFEQRAAERPYQDRLGQTRYQTGKSFFVGRYINIELAAGFHAPFPFNDPPVITLTISLTASASGNIIFTFGVSNTGTQYDVVWSASAPLSPTINKPARGRLSYFTVESSGSPGAKNITAAYTARYGSIAGLAGQKIFLAAKPIHIISGYAGVELQTSAIITA